MPICSICSHPKRRSIDKDLVAGERSQRRIATQFSVSESALRRHRQKHLPERLKVASAKEEEQNSVDVMTELRRCFERLNKLFDACDRWLTDPDDPSRYDIGPRAEEITVVYKDLIDGRVVMRKASLAELLTKAADDPGKMVTMVETKHADIRVLLLKTAARLQPQIELLGKLVGELDERPINIFLTPMWGQLEQALMEGLADHPDARRAVSARLAALEAGT